MGKNSQPQKTGSRNVLTKSVIREFSSGGLVFQKKNGDPIWLVRKTAASNLFPKQYWMLPKGWIDNAAPDVPGPMASGAIKADEESLQKAAIREVAEEGGIEAKIIKKIGTEKYFLKHPERGQILKFVTFYLMEWQKDSPEGFDDETAEIAWLPFPEAKKRLTFSAEKQMLIKAQELLAPVA
jgi:8-oxo-dGTP pyrophosphatase MutT (NUDIX family)